jgi:hypothetical protein
VGCLSSCQLGGSSLENRHMCATRQNLYGVRRILFYTPCLWAGFATSSLQPHENYSVEDRWLIPANKYLASSNFFFLFFPSFLGVGGLVLCAIWFFSAAEEHKTIKDPFSPQFVSPVSPTYPATPFLSLLYSVFR